MTDTTRPPTTTDPLTARRSLFARCWLVGGALWLGAGLVHGASGWRFDLASWIWLASDVAIGAGLVGLLQQRLHGTSRAGSIALVVALAGRAAFAGGEVTSLIQGHDENPLIPLAAMLTALSMSVFGAVVIRRHLVEGAGRWAPLSMGLYPFLAMFPVVAVTGEPSYSLIGLWGIPMACVAATVMSVAGRSAAARGTSRSALVVPSSPDDELPAAVPARW